MSKPTHIFSLSKNYTRLTVWHGSQTFRNLLGTSVVVPDKGLTRKERYAVLAKELFSRFKIPAPSYRPTKREKQS